MTTDQAQIDAADGYEALFVPALFGPWAANVADAARIRPGHRVLDVACGTGILSREVLARIGPAGSIVGLDPHPGMLTVAERLAPTVDWRQGVAEALPFPDRSFDAVVCQFGLMFFSDRRQALREMMRVLAPGGRLAVAVWSSLDDNPAYASEVELLDRVAGRDAGDALRAPFALGDRDELAALFEEIASVEIETQLGEARFPSVQVMVEADLRGWLPVMGVMLTEDKIAGVLDEAKDSLDSYVGNDGGVRFQTTAHLVTSSTAPSSKTTTPLRVDRVTAMPSSHAAKADESAPR